MAKYTITYKCGHTEEIQLYGPLKERNSRIAYYASIDCPACRAKKASEEAEKAGLPALKGSDKQVAWACDIRGEFTKIAKDIRSRCAGHDDQPAVKELLNKVSDILANDSARYWIDNRDGLTSKRAFMENYKNL